MTKNFTQVLAQSISIIKEIPIPHALLIAICILIIWVTLDVSESINFRNALKHNAIHIQLKKNPSEELFPDELTWFSEQIKEGDNLSTVFDRIDISSADLVYIMAAAKDANLNQVLPGESLLFGISRNSLQEFHYIISKSEKYIFKRKNESFLVFHKTRTPDKFFSYREGQIKSSFYLSAKDSHIPDNIIMELVEIFSWDIDFVYDIRSGDSFSILFEEKYIDGEKLSNSNVVAATFNLRGDEIIAIRYEKSDKSVGYYSPEGVNMKKAFVRAPLDLFRISSGFNLQRKHPIHKKIKAHRGVDYAAPTGTAVYASGDGRVMEAGFNKFNGNYVLIEHGSTYQTKYLHLNEIFVRRNQKVKQRQKIGTVGSTGYSTGPHLHYEFLVNGIHRNPRTVNLPKADPISETEIPAFKSTAKTVMRKLDLNKKKSNNVFSK